MVGKFSKLVSAGKTDGLPLRHEMIHVEKYFFNFLNHSAMASFRQSRWLQICFTENDGTVENIGKFNLHVNSFFQENIYRHKALFEFPFDAKQSSGIFHSPQQVKRE